MNLETTIRKVQRRYRSAYREAANRLKRDEAKLISRDKEMRNKYEKGYINDKQYNKWRNEAVQQLKKDIRILSSIIGGADQLAVSDINEQVPSAYSEAKNAETYYIERELGIDTNYTLVIPEAITKGMYGEFFHKVDIRKNTAWNRRRIVSVITRGLISGQSVQDIVDNMSHVVRSNEKYAERNARTWIGSAVTGGRFEAALRAYEHGVKLAKYWDATLDMKTRESHRLLHMEKRDIPEPFSNGGMYPRDPDLPPKEKCNCRCEMYIYPEGITPDFDGQIRDFPEGYTYNDWREGKSYESKGGRQKQRVRRRNARKGVSKS